MTKIHEICLQSTMSVIKYCAFTLHLFQIFLNLKVGGYVLTKVGLFTGLARNKCTYMTQLFLGYCSFFIHQKGSAQS